MDNERLDALETRMRGLEALTKESDERFKSIEQLQAIMITMYAELWASIEAMAGSVIGEDTEAKQKFSEKQQQALKAIFEAMVQTGRETNMEAVDDEAKSAMEHFIRGT